MHPIHAIPHPATYARGRTRIDYVLASTEVSHAVDECGYEPFKKNEKILSDHRGYFNDFDLQKLFGNELQRLASLPFCDVRGKDTISVTQYVEAKDTYITDHNFYTRIDTLKQLSEPNAALMEQLDRDWERASKTAGKKSRKARRSWWSTKLAKARHKTNLYRTLLSMLRQRRDYSMQLQRLHIVYVPPSSSLLVSENAAKPFGKLAAMNASLSKTLSNTEKMNYSRISLRVICKMTHLKVIFSATCARQKK
jgi:hypothetical protein